MAAISLFLNWNENRNSMKLAEYHKEPFDADTISISNSVKELCKF